MALAQRPGARFFAAFYRWSRHTHGPCTLSPQASHPSRRPATLAIARAYHETCRLTAEERSTHVFMQELESSVAATQEDTQTSAEPHAQTPDPPNLKEDVRRLMRKVPASVNVVTVAHVDPSTNESVPMGIAVSSLTTVTLDPPTISFNIKRPSQALDAIRQANGRFRVHWLTPHGSSRTIIEHFCNGNHTAAYEQRRERLEIDIPKADPDSNAAASLAPRLRGPGPCAAAECTLIHQFDVDDHVILVARVDSLERDKWEDSTIVYVDGAYRKLDLQTGISEPKDHSLKELLDRNLELSIAYGHPGSSGETERREFAERLASYAVNLQRTRRIQPGTIIKQLQPETRRVASSLGVDLFFLTRDCWKLKGTDYAKALPEFYGRLSTAKLAKLGSRMVQLVKADTRFLAVPYIKLLRYLDVVVSESTLLPSDLLNPLRAEGLLPPFDPSTSTANEGDPKANVLAMEQFEHAIRTQMSQKTDDQKLRFSRKDMWEKANVPPASRLHFQESATALRVGTCESFSTVWPHDVAGDLTPEEARVVIRRLVDYAGADRIELYFQRQSNAVLRAIGVHPLTSGLNIDFLVDKIGHLAATVKDPSSLRASLDDILQPYFASSVTEEDLETRIEQFVHKLPIRATAWDNADALAAMGLSGRTLISTNVTETPKTIDESNLLDALMAKALKSYYGKGTEEENQAMATFLQTRYGYDATGEPTGAKQEEA